MGWRVFRSFYLGGGFRATTTNAGIGVSWGIPSFRVGLSATGRKWISVGIPGTGIYFTRALGRPCPEANVGIQSWRDVR